MPLTWCMTLGDFSSFVFQGLQIITIHLCGKLPFYAADRLFHVVGDRLREAPHHTGNLLHLAVHSRDQFLFIFVKYGTPLFLWLQIDKVLGIKKAGCIGSIIRTPHLAPALSDLGERAKHDAGLVHDSDTLGRPGAGRKRATRPDRALIQMGQEFRADRRHRRRGSR